MNSQSHKEQADQKGPVKVALVTCSDTRRSDDDANGIFLKQQIESQGDIVTEMCIIPDEPSVVSKKLEALSRSQAQIIIFNGGTGISPRDNTYDALVAKMDKVLPGFGEIFRMLSYEQVGAAAILSRAVAGVYNKKVIISIPGSPKAVHLAWEKIISPELKHLAWEVAR